MTAEYRFAEKIIKISSLYPEVHALCADYLCGGEPDFTVATKPSDIEYERVKSARERLKEGLPQADFPPSYLEELAVYRKIAEKMPLYGTVLFHCSAVEVDGTAYLFTAKSGTGKSTHASLWKQLLGEKVRIINDDKPLLHIEKTGVTVYGTPWDGKHRLSENTSAPVKALCLLTRGEKDSIRPVSPGEALPLLLQQVYRPEDPAAMAETLKLMDILTSGVGLYRLECTPLLSAAEIAYESLRGL